MGKSIKSDPFPSPLLPIIWLRLMDGEPWFLIVLERLKTASSLILLLDFAPARSKREHRAVPKDWQNTTSCYALRKSWVKTPNMLAKTLEDLGFGIFRRSYKWVAAAICHYPN